MRAILIDWLALVCTKSKLCPEVLYLTVNILDRFLDKTKKKVTKKNLQLVGTACLFISSKYEDIYHVPVDDLVYLCDRAYSVEQIYEMETTILKTLNYQISLPTTYKFLLRFLNAGHCGKQMIYTSTYILELSMLSIQFIDYMPSEIAAAAVMIARRSADRNLWSPTLLHYSGYTEEEILPIARNMIKAAAMYPDLTSANRKYSSERKLKVAYMLPKSL
jgi:transcription initiation factor TFIIIB Brf1 subunit/transcription initiation factor TFIIB